MVKTKETYSDKLKRLAVEGEAKRVKLEEKYKTKIKMHILAAGEEHEPCIIFFRVANTFTKMQCMDLMYQSPSKAASTLFDATILREESDKRVFTQDNDEDFFYLAAIQLCKKHILIASDYLKKK